MEREVEIISKLVDIVYYMMEEGCDNIDVTCQGKVKVTVSYELLEDE